MSRLVVIVITVVTLTAGSVAAQDARSVLEAAANTLGVTNMTSIQYTGTGWLGAVGQNFSPDQDWPRFELANYTRTIDFSTSASREDMVIRLGNYAASPDVVFPPLRGEQAWQQRTDPRRMMGRT